MKNSVKTRVEYLKHLCYLVFIVISVFLLFGRNIVHRQEIHHAGKKVVKIGHKFVQTIF